MRAQRARCDAVNSYESKRAVMRSLVRSDKRPFHESCVCVELIWGRHAGFGIRSRSAKGEVNLADKPFKIRNRGWVAPFGVRTCGIRRCC